MVKRIVIGLAVLSFACGAVYGYSQWQSAKAETEFVTWVAKYRPGWQKYQIQEGWVKIKNSHALINP